MTPPRRSTRRSVFCVALSCLGPGLVACGSADAPPSGWTPQVQDSAGVRIVEIPLSAPGAGHAWTVGETPRTRIGAATGAEAELLANVRHGTVLSDGRIVIANGQPIEARVFGPDGRHLTTFGRMGEGPGEFGVNGISGLHALGGDTLAVENGGRGVHFFSPDGALLLSIPGPAQAGVGSSETASWLGGGSYLVTQPGSSPSAGPPASGVYAPPTRYVVWSEETGPRTLGTFDGVVQFRPAGGPPGTPNIALPSPFGRRVVHAAGTERFYAGDMAGYVISAFTYDGQLTRIVRRAYEPIPVSEAERVAARERARAGPLFRIPALPAAMIEQLERQLEAMPLPETFPAFDELLEDRSGHLWVRRVHPEAGADAQPVAQHWEVFGPDGVLQATVEVPPVARVLEIGEDYILAVSRGAYDVESVELYELRREGHRLP